MIRVLLAEDQVMMRGALAKLLALEPDIEVVAEVGSGSEVVSAAATSRPDVALLDIEMPVMTGLEACALLRQQFPGCKVIILTTFGRPGYLRRAMDSGAAGFLVKDAPVHHLALAIRKVMAGERVVDPDLALEALGEGTNPLTDREQEVLRAACGGASIAEIAAKLHISQGTVRNHLSVASQKLNARNHQQALYTAQQKGWI